MDVDPMLCRAPLPEELELIENLLIYQFGRHVLQLFNFIEYDKLRICVSTSTGKIRKVMYGNELLMTLRASDYSVIPHIPLAKMLVKLIPFPKLRVVVVDEMKYDILSKASTVFAKHVLYVDPDIRPNDEVFVVDEFDNLLCVGKALLSADLMITSTYGAAVMLRECIRCC